MKRYFPFFALLALVAGCGGGAGGSSVSATHTALVTLTTTGTPANSQIGVIDVTLNLPAGVSVNAVPFNGNPAVLVPAPGVITLKGAAATTASQSLLTASYLPGSPNKVRFSLISAGGVPVADTLATIACDIAAGSTPLPTDFSITPNLGTTGVFDTGSAALPGVVVQFSAAIN